MRAMPELASTFIERPYRTETKCCGVPWSVMSQETLDALHAHEARHFAEKLAAKR